MVEKPKYFRKKLNLDEGVPLAKDIQIKEIDNKFLLVSSEAGQWGVFDNKEISVVRRMIAGRTSREILSELETHLTRQQAEMALQKTVEQLIIRGFCFRDFAEENIVLCMSLSDACNLRCIHCLYDSGRYSDEMPLERWFDIIESFTNVFGTGNVIKFSTGGEPLLHKGFWEISEFIKSKGQSIYLVTNATLIDEAMIRRLSGLVDYAQISIDGATAEVNDAVRGNGTFAKIVEAVELLRNEQIPVCLGFAIMPQNLKGLEENLADLYSSFHDDGIDLRMSPLITEGRGVSLEGFSEERGEGKKIKHALWRKLISSGMCNTITRGKIIKKHNCGYGKEILVFPNGDFKLCDHSMNGGNIASGDSQETFREIKAVNDATALENNPVCSDCLLRYNCLGDCILKNMNIYDRYCKPSCGEEFRSNVYSKLLAMFEREYLCDNSDVTSKYFEDSLEIEIRLKGSLKELFCSIRQVDLEATERHKFGIDQIISY